MGHNSNRSRHYITSLRNHCCNDLSVYIFYCALSVDGYTYLRNCYQEENVDVKSTTGRSNTVGIVALK